jgi:hypothetical protein
VPAELFTAAEGAHTLELIEWSDDNKHFLVKHNFTGGNEFIVISRDQPATSININRFLKTAPSSVVLRDKNFDEWYVYTQQGGILQTADAKGATAQLVTGVTSFKPHDDDTLLYAQTASDGQTQRIHMREGGDTYVIRDVPAGTVFLDLARYDGDWYAVVGSDADKKTYVFKNPNSQQQKANPASRPVPHAILKATGPITWVAFSQNTRFIVSQSNGQHFEVHDNEYDQTAVFDITEPFGAGTKVSWMDGHRLTGRTANKAVIFDFNGANKQELVSSLPSSPLLFDRDYTVLYTVDAIGETGAFGFAATDLRLDGDK